MSTNYTSHHLTLLEFLEQCLCQCYYIKLRVKHTALQPSMYCKLPLNITGSMYKYLNIIIDACN